MYNINTETQRFFSSVSLYLCVDIDMPFYFLIRLHC